MAPVAEQVLVFTWHSTWDGPDESMFKPLLAFLSPSIAQGKSLIPKPLPCLVHRVQAHFFWSQNQLWRLRACRRAQLCPHHVSAEKWNNIFLLLLFIPGVRVCNSPMHPCSSLLIKAIFCNIVFFTLPTFIVIKFPLGESSQCSRMVTVNNPGSGWNKQESRTWWCYNIPY